MQFQRYRRAASLAPLLAALTLLIAGLVLLALSTSPNGGGAAQEAIRTDSTPIADDQTRDAEPATRNDAVRDSTRQSTQPGTRLNEGAAPLDFDLPFLQLGIIEPGTVHTHVIGVTNTSDERLTLRDIHTGCNCTTAYLEGGESVWEPGETLNLAIETEARYRLITKSVSVNIAVYEYKGAARFTTRFEVNNTVAADPPFVNARERRTGRISLRSIDSRPFRVLSVHGEPPIFPPSEQYDPETDDPRTRYTIEWDFSGTELPPRLLVIETDHPDSRVFALVVFNNEIARRERQHFRGTMGGSQTEANLGYVTPGETREITVKYTHIPDPSQITSRFIEHDDVQDEIIETRPGESDNETYVTFRIAISEEIEPGRLLRPLNVQTNSASRRLWLYGIVEGDRSQN